LDKKNRDVTVQRYAAKANDDGIGTSKGPEAPIVNNDVNLTVSSYSLILHCLEGNVEIPQELIMVMQTLLILKNLLLQCNKGRSHPIR